MFRDPIVMLRSEARKNPILASMLDNIQFVTEDEIQSLRVLPWVRRTLLDMKKAAEEAVVVSSLRAWLETQIIEGTVPDPMGETRQWLGDNTFLALKRGHLEIRYGELVWFDQTGGVWIDTIYCNPPDPRLLSQTQVVGQMTKLAYFQAVRDKARKYAPADAPLIQGLSDPAANSPLASAGVSFYRP